MLRPFLALLAALLPAAGACAAHVFIASTETDQVLRLTNADNFAYGSPTWSPDGKRIAYDWWESGLEFDAARLGVVDVETGDETFLGRGAMPSWSPDGKRLVCHTYNPHEIVIVDLKFHDDEEPDDENPDKAELEEGDRESILRAWGSPRWSPDGKSIYLCTGGISRYDVASKQMASLFSRNRRYSYSLERGFCPSPDGKQIAFQGRGGLGVLSLTQAEPAAAPPLRIDLSGFDGLADVAVDADDHSPAVRWLTECDGAPQVSWSPQGDKIAFAKKTDTGARIFLVNTEGEPQPEPLTSVPEGWHAHACDWSPDGKWIAFIAGSPDDVKHVSELRPKEEEVQGMLDRLIGPAEDEALDGDAAEK